MKRCRNGHRGENAPSITKDHEGNHDRTGRIEAFLDGAFQTMDNVLARQEAELRDREIGIVKYVGYGIVRVGGLPNFEPMN